MKYIAGLFFMFAVFTAAGQYAFDYSDIRSGKFTQKTVAGLRTMANGEHYTVVESGRIEKYAYKTGEFCETVFDAGEFPELATGFEEYQFSTDETKIVLTADVKPIYRRSFTADHWIYDTADGRLRRLTGAGAEQAVTLSPDGTKAAFVRDNDIYLVDLSSPEWPVSRVTDDGRRNEIINGHTDWVYEEEFAFTRAFEFSPDGSRIAWLRFDETEVPQVTITRFTDGLYPVPSTFKYPRAGEKNAAVELWVYSLADGSKTKIDTGPETDRYISRIGWTPAGTLWFYLTNRLQNHFRVMVCESITGEPRAIYEEKDRRYVERPDDETVTFLPDGKFIVKNETSGNTHLYMYDPVKGVTDTLTRGSWDVTGFLGVAGGRAYYISNEDSPLRRNFYSVRLNGKGKTRLTSDEGVCSVAPSAGFKYFVSYFSNSATPNLVRLHDSGGKVLRVLEDNAELRRTVEARNIPRKEFFRFTTERGTALNGYMVKPADFDPAQKYPVLMVQYSGPGSQQVLDRWTIDWTDVLVQEGNIIVCVDGRGTGGRGAEFKKVTYGNLGGCETEGQISAAKYMATQPYVDISRIGIYGWSYGGFMVLNCMLKGADVFKTGIAVAPVTSWRFYDTVYTEIYNGLPQDNPRGYDDNSPVNFAGNLKGNLLIIHGSTDDNVHFQNSMAMADALVKAGKQFDMMVYPDDNHSMMPTGRHHVMERMIEYILDKL